MTENERAAAIAREEELKSSAWKTVVNGGAQTRRFLNTHDSAWMAVDTLLELDPLELEAFRGELERICSIIEKFPKRALPSKGIFSFLFGLIFGRS